MTRLSTGRVLTAIVGIYAAQSVVGGLVFQAVPAVLRQQGLELGLIGLVWLLMLPHALKFLWAPPVERLRLRPDGARRSRAIILAGQALAMLALLGMAVAGMNPTWLFLMLALATITTATVDIACDAFAVEQLPGRARGWGNVMQVGGAYLGVMVGGGLFLVMVARFGFSAAALVLALVVGLLMVPLLLTREPPGDAAVQSAHRAALGHALRRPGFRRALLVIVAMQVGLRIAHGLLGPFLVDRGFDLETLGLLTGVGGTIASLAGTLLAAWLAGRRPAATLLAPAVLLQGLVFGGLAALAFLPGVPREAMAVMALLLGFSVGAGFVLLYTAMMGWAAGPQPGVDYTLLQCADAAMAVVAGTLAGAMAQRTGYGACFMLAAVLALLAATVLPRLTRSAEARP
nr:MFS transporter [uncultured Roseococcus sp.]